MAMNQLDCTTAINNYQASNHNSHMEKITLAEYLFRNVLYRVYYFSQRVKNLGFIGSYAKELQQKATAPLYYRMPMAYFCLLTRCCEELLGCFSNFRP